MDPHDWQRALRVQAGEEARLRLRNLGDQPLFSEYAVTNPESRTYRVAIRGEALGVNYCSCPDFTSSRLGICKHIAFVLKRLRRSPAAARQLSAGWTPPFSELAVAYDGHPRLRLLLGTDCPKGLRTLAHRLRGPDGTLDDDQALPRLLATAQRRGHELRVYDDARALIARRRDQRQREERLRAAFPRGASDPDLRGLLRDVTLHPYQCEGAWFLAERGRALLADDMGLGKTVQAIAAAVLSERTAGVRQVLVVAPASVVGQWAEEIARCTGRTPLLVRGLIPARERLWADPTPWKVATYDLLHRDLPAIRAWGVDLLILDEAQRIKNWPTRAAQAVRRLDPPLRFVLTGTPLENRLDELHSLIEVVDRHLLGPLFALRNRHSETDPDSGKVVGYRDLDQLGAALAPVLLRRTRAQVMADLPGRTVTRLDLPLTPRQRALHEEDREHVAIIVERWKRQRFLSAEDQEVLMMLLMRMRMVCDDAFLIDPPHRHGAKASVVLSIIRRELSDPTVKIVVFSAWMDMHTLIREVIATLPWQPAFLHGGIPAAARGALIRRFRDDPACRIFCATDCGATGLNLQCATALINVDLPWNPAVREQRISRIHRQGQRRPVRIYDLVAEHSIESAIARLLTFKSALAAGILDGGPASVRMEGSALQRMMATVESIDRVLGPVVGDSASAPATAATRTDPGHAAPAAAPGDRMATGARASGGPSTLPLGSFDLGATLHQASTLFADLGRLATTARLTTDPASGQTTLQLPLPDAAALGRLGASLAALQQALGVAALAGGARG